MSQAHKHQRNTPDEQATAREVVARALVLAVRESYPDADDEKTEQLVTVSLAQLVADPEGATERAAIGKLCPREALRELVIVARRVLLEPAPAANTEPAKLDWIEGQVSA